MRSKTGRFQRADRILCSRDFSRAIKSGKRRTSRCFAVSIAQRSNVAVGEFTEERSRLGVTVSKRVGNSVIRNRIKRRIREWFRLARKDLQVSSDIVVTARRAARELSGREMAAVLDEMIDAPRIGGNGRTMVEPR